MADNDIDLISSSVTLPNGIVVPNRLGKAAMEEGIGYAGLPTQDHHRLYKRWAEGGWGIIITGNVQVDPRHLATPHDLTIPSSSSSTVESYRDLHATMLDAIPPSTSKPLILMQVSHPGLQSSSSINLSRAPWDPAIGPCCARPDTGDSLMGWLVGRMIWPVKSRAVSANDEWLGIVERFVRAAMMAEEAGWGGVQLHAAHGYLLAEYLSPLTNPKPIPLPRVPTQIPLRLHLLYLILTGIHAVTRSDFVKSVKVNCSDFVQGGLDEEQSAQSITEIVSWKLVDILEISGGNYSSPAFATLESISIPSSARQSLFARFTTSLLPDLPSPPKGPAIMLTGGLHDRSLIASSLRTRACDLVGIGRPACVNPTLPRDVILDCGLHADETRLGGYRIRGAATMRYIMGGGRSTATASKPGKPVVASYAETEKTPLVSKDATEEQKSTGVPFVGAGVSTLWHEWQLCRIGRGKEPDIGMDWLWGGLMVEGVWFGIFGGGSWGWWTSWRGRG